ncbi:MAG: hypothetical protein ACODAJ_06175 [Planctomycetota bacterium]
MDDQDKPQGDAPQPQEQPGAGGDGEAGQGPPPPPQDAPAPPPGEMARLDLGAYLSKSWQLVKNDPVLFIVGYIVVFAIVGVLSFTIIGPAVVGVPLLFGYLRMAHKRLNDEPAEFGDIFSGFQQFGKGAILGLILFGLGVVLAIVSILLGFIPVLGQLACIALSLAFNAAIYFVLPIAALSEVQPGESIKRSFEFLKAHFWPVVLLALVTWAIGAVGMVACCVGALVTMPMAMAITVIAYQDFYLANAGQGE